MVRLFENVILNLTSQYHHPALEMKHGGRCDLMEYYDLPRATNWLIPDLTREGPCAHGLQNHFCTDCSGCNAQRKGFLGEDGNIATYEYIPVEFARDREFQTNETSTSQATLAAYLKKTYKRDLCVVNSGIHDMLLNSISTEQYTTNVLEYLQHIERHCARIIWILTNAVKGDERYAQNNDILFKFNENIRENCQQIDSKVLIVDIWNMSFPETLHADNIHMQKPYYQELANLILLQ